MVEGSEINMSQEELDKLTSLVRESIGADDKRGDSIKVVSAPFQAPKEEVDDTPLWKKPETVDLIRTLAVPGALTLAALIVVALLWAFVHGGSTLAPLAIGLAVFVIAGALVDLVERIGLFRNPLGIAWRRARGLPRATWGTAFAHAGVGVALIGIVCESTWNSEYIATMRPNDATAIAGYQVKLDGLSQRQGPNYREMFASFAVIKDGQLLSTMTPSKRSFSTRGMSTSEAALLTRGVSQLYISLGEVAAVQPARGPTSIRTENGQLATYIYVDIQGRDLGGYVEDARRAVQSAVAFPPGTYVMWSGQYEYMQRAKEKLWLNWDFLLEIMRLAALQNQMRLLMS